MAIQNHHSSTIYNPCNIVFFIVFLMTLTLNTLKFLLQKINQQHPQQEDTTSWIDLDLDLDQETHKTLICNSSITEKTTAGVMYFQSSSSEEEEEEEKCHTTFIPDFTTLKSSSSSSSVGLIPRTDDTTNNTDEDDDYDSLYFSVNGSPFIFANEEDHSLSSIHYYNIQESSVYGSAFIFADDDVGGYIKSEVTKELDWAPKPEEEENQSLAIIQQQQKQPSGAGNQKKKKRGTTIKSLKAAEAEKLRLEKIENMRNIKRKALKLEIARRKEIKSVLKKKQEEELKKKQKRKPVVLQRNQTLKVQLGKPTFKG